MIIENSIVIANYIRGIYVPLAILTSIVGLWSIITAIGFATTRNTGTYGCLPEVKAIWTKIAGWTLGTCLPFLLFSLWFFNTFTLRG